jgi:CubicO group peptidase (beta-lactamase class C family)
LEHRELLERIIVRGCGEQLHDFARQRLFDPLAIGPTKWLAARSGDAIAASGLRMTPRDLARIGLIMRNGGLWNGGHIGPPQWVERSTSPIVDVDEIHQYGYHWYLGKFEISVAAGPRWDRSRLERF